MAQVQTALHRQLDALNEYRFINLESEMDALADMLKSDGLTGEEVSGGDILGDMRAAASATGAKASPGADPFGTAAGSAGGDPIAELFAGKRGER